MLTIAIAACLSSQVTALSSDFYPPSSCAPFDEPIDFVYTWVNGSDLDFVASINSYKEVDVDDSFKNERLSNNRYADFDQIKYSLRSVERFAPWVNHIYIVTNGHQVPSWLNQAHPDISVVSHAQIWRYPEHLPNFQSGAIEANLHRIEGLTEKFVYFNDDFGLIAKTCPSDFYTKKEGYKLYASMQTVRCDRKCPNELLRNGECNEECNKPMCAFDGGDCGDEDISTVLPIYPDGAGVHTTKQISAHHQLTRLFGGADRLKHPHLPIMINREIMEEMQVQMEPVFANMSSHRFRDNYDMQYQFLYDNYLRETKKYKFVDVYSEDGRKDGHINLDNKDEKSFKSAERQIEKLLKALESGDHGYLFMCVQDKIDHDKESAVIIEELIQDKFYEVVFPHLSQFELGSDYIAPVEEKVITKTITSDELSITESVRVRSLDEKPTRIGPIGIDGEFTRLVIAIMLAMTILYTVRFILVRRMGFLLK